MKELTAERIVYLFELVKDTQGADWEHNKKVLIDRVNELVRQKNDVAKVTNSSNSKAKEVYCKCGRILDEVDRQFNMCYECSQQLWQTY